MSLLESWHLALSLLQLNKPLISKGLCVEITEQLSGSTGIGLYLLCLPKAEAGPAHTFASDLSVPSPLRAEARRKRVKRSPSRRDVPFRTLFVVNEGGGLQNVILFLRIRCHVSSLTARRTPLSKHVCIKKPARGSAWRQYA